MFINDIDSFFESNSNQLSEIRHELSLLDKYDIIYALENTSDKKEGVITKLINMIRDMIRECMNLISKAAGAIGNHVRYGLLSKKEKARYDEYQDYLDKNPHLKKKELTVKDWQKIEREYDKVEKNIVKMMNDNVTDANGMNLKTKDMFNDLAAITNSATASITIDMVLSVARKSPQAAEDINRALSHCKETLDNIDEQLGEGTSAKLQKKLHKLSKQTMGQKLLSKLYHQKEKTLFECMKEVSTNLEKAMSGEATFKDKAKVAIEHRELAKSAGKAYIHDERTRKGVNKIIKTKKEIDNNDTLQSVMKFGKEIISPSV